MTVLVAGDAPASRHRERRIEGADPRRDGVELVLSVDDGRPGSLEQPASVGLESGAGQRQVAAGVRAGPAAGSIELSCGAAHLALRFLHGPSSLPTDVGLGGAE